MGAVSLVTDTTDKNGGSVTLSLTQHARTGAVSLVTDTSDKNGGSVTLSIVTDKAGTVSVTLNYQLANNIYRQ